MKATDLMIDDLIRTPRGIERVECPGQRSVVTKSGCYGIDDVKPIVFTEELAQKNRITICRDRLTNVTSIWANNRDNVMNKRLIVVDDFKKLRYVHQVQQALRLYGWKKEVVI